MPVAQQWAYFDHAAVAPLSQPAVDAITQYTLQAANLGDTVWPQWAARIEHLRETVAGMIGAQKGEICMVPNTTTGINLVAEGWPWQKGDNVILPEGEFPSNLFPWLNQQSRGVEVRIVPRRRGQGGRGQGGRGQEREGEVCIDDLLEQVDDSTRMIAVSWVGYASGYRIDLDSLVHQAHQRGVLVFLDAIQGLGMFPLDLKKTPVDFLAADGHKWLLGPEGAGIAMIRSEHIDRLRCGNIGWGSVKNSHNYTTPSMDLKNEASRFEPGSANMIGSTALAASVDLFAKVIQTHSPDAIQNRVLQLVENLDSRLREVGAIPRTPTAAENRSGIVTFDVPSAEPNEIRSRGLDQKVVVSCRDGGVRASVHVYNNQDDIDRLVDVVRSFV